ncbi:MAG: Astacin [Pseudomonadota bacterium]|jgi:hypothetical protein
MKFVELGSLLLLSCLTAVSCGGFRDSRDSFPETVFFANSVWPSARLRVCWEFKNSQTEEFTSQFKTVVERAFQGTKLSFSGWAVCPRHTRNTDLRIFIYDDPLADTQVGFADVRSLLGQAADRGHPRVPVPGRKMRGKRANVIFNLSGLHSDPFLGQMYDSLSPIGRRNLALSSSLHEFGHAIGLRHENVHPDNTCVGFDENLEWGDNIVTPYNPGSFMQRCFYRNFDYETGIVWPNEGDLEGINRIYR